MSGCPRTRDPRRSIEGPRRPHPWLRFEMDRAVPPRDQTARDTASICCWRVLSAGISRISAAANLPCAAQWVDRRFCSSCVGDFGEARCARDRPKGSRHVNWHGAPLRICRNWPEPRERRPHRRPARLSGEGRCRRWGLDSWPLPRCRDAVLVEASFIGLTERREPRDGKS